MSLESFRVEPGHWSAFDPDVVMLEGVLLRGLNDEGEFRPVIKPVSAWELRTKRLREKCRRGGFGRPEPVRLGVFL